MTHPQDLDTLLRSMDAADAASPADPVRARADLARILAHHPGPAVQTASRPGRNGPTGRRKVDILFPPRRAVLLGGLVAAMTAGLLVLPALDGGDPAFATWTAAPTTLTHAEQDRAVAECRAANKDSGDGLYAEDVAAAEVAIAERRGVWMTVVLTGADNFSATCITDDSAPWFKKGMIGSIGRPGSGTVPPARGLAATQLGTGVVMDQAISIASGQAGSDVAGITYRSITGGEVVATVSRGEFALWLPGDELKDASDHGVSVKVTYLDGTTDMQSLNF
jgi:hypothetical protein